ncbi:MAG: type I polyketide synthase, partial [Deltaproteobacteria bacterium]
QARAVQRAYERAPFNADKLDFIEGHGTGTAVGDQVELEGISRAMRAFLSDRQDAGRFCGMTSLKSLIGHTKAAAGIGAFIKAVMAVNRRVFPPTAGCRDPHPVFKAEAHALYPVLTGKKTDQGDTLRAGVSAMGFGGINCHVCIESADPPIPKLTPSFNEKALLASHQETELFIFSGNSPVELITQADNLIEEVRGISIADLTDLAADLSQKIDNKHGVRAAIVANHPDQLSERMNRLSAILQETPPDSGKLYQDTKNQIWAGNRMTAPRIGFLFPGQGAQQLNMARRLIDRHDWAERILTRADTLLDQDGRDPVGPIIYRDLDPAYGSNQARDWAKVLAQTAHAQPAICLNSLLWHSWLEKMGIRPAAAGGHSLGELTAFYAAGGFDADTLIRFAGFRGKIFAEQTEKNGAMVSLRCSRKKAESLISSVDGYAVLSNINSPRQMVVAGEEAAISQILKNAAKDHVPAYRLSVSGAFHTKLVSGAANELKKEALLPPSLKKPTCRLFSGMDGKEIKPGRVLKDYFSDQVLTPVDFTALVHSMGKVCDLFIEVGPGQALTGMINDINGDTGPLCFPVESIPGRDRDTSQLLGVLFAHGTEINWDNVYKSRLTRPFIRPSKRLFFENPCERPFDTTDPSKLSLDFPHAESMASLFSGLGDISKEKVENYLKTRGAFLAKVIQADMDYPVSDVQWVPAAETGSPVEKISPGPAKTGQVAPDRLETVGPDKEIDSILFDTLESITGFSRDTLSPDMRLLDDLNLDSIKTGDLLTRVAKAAGILGEIPPMDFSNVTLEEIIHKLSAAKAGKAAPVDTGQPDILAAILDQISKIIGNRPDEINADALLKKDLNIDKDQLKEMLPDLSHRIKIDIHVDLDPLLKRTLRQIASILQRISEQQQMKSIPSQVPHRSPSHPPWVREFHLSMTPQPLKRTKKSKRREDDWHYAHALVLCNNPENEVAVAVANQLSNLGARVDVRTHTAALEQNLPERSEYSHFFNILPDKVNDTQAAYDDRRLREMVTRLAGASAVAPASLAPRRRNTVAYLQFGGGYFGTRSETAFLDQCAATALAASFHQERPDLRVRVLDFSPALSADTIAKKTIEEIPVAGSFTAVGYDQHLVRRERYQRLMDPGTYKTRSFTWSKKDVILVTGGARGITAECALGVARASGARMVLVGRSPLPDSHLQQTTADDITTTIKNYADRDLTARYFSCDICNRDAVNELVEQIQNEMGPITGVIHGAGLNNPKATTQVSIDEAIREVSPKLLGALNLMAALDQTPPKLFLGLTSLSGVVGMHGNAWYGFSNEALDIVLQRFEDDHPQTRTLSIAYSIWKD